MDKRTESVTIKSIAEALGVSFSTVAKALSGAPGIKESTRRMVEEKAREMNYTRNYFARTLRQRSSGTVAVIVSDIDTPVCGEMIAGISAKLAACGYTTMVSDSLYDEAFERSNIQTVLSRMPEAVIISPVDTAGENLRLLRPVFMQTLILADAAEIDQANYLAVDHRMAGRISAEHMIACGNRNNLVFAGPEGYQASRLFLSGVQDAYDAQGLTLSPGAVHHFKPDHGTACERFMRIWQAQPGVCQGVICFCDSMAFGVYQAACQLGLRIGENVSVIGYDDSPMNDFTAPPLTTIHMPKDLVAAGCSRFVIDRLVKGDTQQYAHRLQPHLVDRGSVCKR